MVSQCGAKDISTCKICISDSQFMPTVEFLLAESQAVSYSLAGKLYTLGFWTSAPTHENVLGSSMLKTSFRGLMAIGFTFGIQFPFIMGSCGAPHTPFSVRTDTIQLLKASGRDFIKPPSCRSQTAYDGPALIKCIKRPLITGKSSAACIPPLYFTVSHRYT